MTLEAFNRISPHTAVGKLPFVSEGWLWKPFDPQCPHEAVASGANENGTYLKYADGLLYVQLFGAALHCEDCGADVQETTKRITIDSHHFCVACAVKRGYPPIVKVTAGKPKLAYAFRSTMEAIAAVREYATNGPYKDPNNWKEVADSDWDEALLRHVMAYMEAKKGNGSVYDSLSHIHHLAHVLTNVGFLVENYTIRDKNPIKEIIK